jgi:hypothetical protein
VPAALQYVRVDLCRPDIGMAEQLLHRLDIIARFDQVCGKRVPQSVAANALVYR